MSDHIVVNHETGRRITASDECALVKAAFEHRPNSTLLRERLATLLNLCEAFDETLALLEPVDDGSLSYSEAMMLARAHIAQENSAGARRGRAASRVALARAENDTNRAAALAIEGAALKRLGESKSAESRLRRALELNPGNGDACKRLASLYMARNDPGSALTMSDRLLSQGVRHSHVLAARMLALAALGVRDAAREIEGRDTFACRTELSPPPGWASLKSFNAALAAELLAHRELRFERYGTASEQTWRIDALATGDAPLVGLLLEQIRLEAESHIRRITDHAHPWIEARPKRGMLHGWCVITEGAGHESWHVHQAGWLSGVYYVQVPGSVAAGEGQGGCIAFGIPDDVVTKDGAEIVEGELVRPSAGLLMMFPSHNYHRTFPHGSNERRICLAFDIRPE